MQETFQGAAEAGSKEVKGQMLEDSSGRSGKEQNFKTLEKGEYTERAKDYS